ncbi:MAG: hypothetical protein HYZ16_05260 [Bacteroidetes bacterium]|jgi:hypothetical protein|nr:hypothetical protein [Bacteroidota bacterium]
MYKHYASPWFIGLALAMLIAAVSLNTKKFGKVGDWEDIYYIYLESKRIAEGENPYERVLAGNMRDNDKYATYFPLLYTLGSGIIVLGAESFVAYQQVWQVISVLCLLAIGFLVYHTLASLGYYLLGFFAVAFVLFNRWTLYVSGVAQIDFIAMLPLLLSLLWLRKNFVIALMLFGLSLAVKQIAIFLTPLYMVWAWQVYGQRLWALRGLVYAAAIPLLVSLPFMIWNLKGFIYSVFFSATRNPSTHIGADSMDVVMHMAGLAAKLPMLGMMGLVFVLAYTKKLGPMLATAFVFILFIDFNSVLFRQYFVWALPFLALAVADFKPRSLNFYPQDQQ